MSNEEYRFLSAPYTIDRKLYKYYSNVEYAIDCIRNRQVHLDDPRSFNDPFDAAVHCTKISALTADDSDAELMKKFFDYIIAVKENGRTIHHQEIIQSYTNFMITSGNMLSNIAHERPVINVINKFYSLLGVPCFSLEEFIDTIDNGFIEKERVIRLNCKISCFSEVCDSILMWSYYSNSHKGVCVEFDLSRLDPAEELTQKIMQGMSKVHYSPIRADLQYSLNNTAGLNFLTTKAEVWEHEHEWRLICETKQEYLPFDCISGVFIGVSFDKSAPKYDKLVKAVNTYNNLPIYQCKLSLDRYQIESEEIYNSYMHTLIQQQKKREPEKIVSNIA